MYTLGDQDILFRFASDPIKSCSHFVVLTLSLFASNQILVLFRSELILLIKVLKFSWQVVRFVSSAYILGFEKLRQFGRSFMYIRKRRGPKMAILGELHRVFL